MMNACNKDASLTELTETRSQGNTECGAQKQLTNATAPPTDHRAIQ